MEKTCYNPRLNAIKDHCMNVLTRSRQDNRFVSLAEKSALSVFNPLHNYKADVIETYKTVLNEIGISYGLYMARHNGGKN